MRVLVTVNRCPSQRYLVHLFTKALIDEVRDLINRKRHPQAVTVVLAKGIFERQISDKEIPTVEADLILSDHNACWDLVK